MYISTLSKNFQGKVQQKMSDTHSLNYKPYIQKVYFKKELYSKEEAFSISMGITKEPLVKFCNGSNYYICIIRKRPTIFKSRKLTHIGEGVLARIYIADMTQWEGVYN